MHTPNTWWPTQGHADAYDQDHYHYRIHQGAWSQPPQPPTVALSTQHFEQWFGNANEATLVDEPDHEYSESPTEGAYPREESSEPDAEEVDVEQESQGGSPGKRSRQSEGEQTPEKRRKRRRSGDKESEDGGERDRKMSRSSRACLGCRRFKVRCMPGPSQLSPDENAPCARCTQNDQPCMFTESHRGKYPVQKLNRLRKVLERQEEVLRLLDELCDSRSKARHQPVAGPSSGRR